MAEGTSASAVTVSAKVRSQRTVSGRSRTRLPTKRARLTVENEGAPTLLSPTPPISQPTRSPDLSRPGGTCGWRRLAGQSPGGGIGRFAPTPPGWSNPRIASGARCQDVGVRPSMGSTLPEWILDPRGLAGMGDYEIMDSLAQRRSTRRHGEEFVLAPGSAGSVAMDSERDTIGAPPWSRGAVRRSLRWRRWAGGVEILRGMVEEVSGLDAETVKLVG